MATGLGDGLPGLEEAGLDVLMLEAMLAAPFGVLEAHGTHS